MPEINTSSPPVVDAGRIAGMVRQFHRAVERQRAFDAEVLRVLGSEQGREIVRDIVREEMQRP